MKQISIIIIISLIAFGSLAINTTNTFSDLVEKVSDTFKVSDTSTEAKAEEALPTFLQLEAKSEIVNNSWVKNFYIKPIGLKSGETPYKSLILMNSGGLELIRADVDQGKVTIKRFVNNSFQTTTQTTFDITSKIIKNEKNYLYTLADDGSTHCTEIATDFFNVDYYKNRTKEQIAPLRKKSKPGWDKLTNQPISDCFFTKPLNDGKSYAWKGDVKATIQKGTFNSKGYSVSFQIKFDKLPKNNDAFLSLKNKKTGQTILRFLFDKGQLLYQNNKGKTFYTNTTIKVKEWMTIGWANSNFNANTFYYINGIQVTNDNESTYIEWSDPHTLEFTKGTGNWEINNLIFWSEAQNTVLNTPLITPKATDINVKGLFLFNEGTGQKMLNDKIDDSGITVNGTGNCTTDWTASTYQPNATLDFNNTVLSTNQSNNTLKIKKGELTTAFTIEFWSVNEMSLYFKELPLTIQFKSNGEFYYDNNTSAYTLDAFSDKLSPEYFKSWHHWAITYTTSSKELTLFKDGVKLKTYKKNAIRLGSNLLKQISRIDIGGKARADELRIWNTIRTEKEIKDNYRYRMETIGCGSSLLLNEHFDKEPTKAAILLSDKKDCQGNAFTKVSKQTLAFDGNDDNIDDKVDIANKSFTMEFWLKRKETSKELYFIRVGEKFEHHQLLHIGFRGSGNFVFAFFGDDLEVDRKYTDDKWHHWACVYDATTKEQKIYQDGVEIGKQTTKKNFSGTELLQLGKGLNNRNGLEGNLAEFRIWDVARTSADINAHKSSPLTGVCPNLLFYYDFDKVKNNELFNLISNKKANLQNFGQTPFVADIIDFKNTAKNGCTVPPGSVDYTLSLNGQSDYVTTSQDIDLSKKPFTIEFWAKRDIDNKKQVIVSHADNLEIGFDANNKCYALSRLSNGMHITAKTASDNNWHHYVYVYDHTYSSHFIFIDGQINAKGTTYKYEKSGKLLLGRNPSGNHPFGGEIDELRIWNKALYANYIKQNYQAKYPNTEKDLLAYYNFNDGQGTTLTDVKNGKNGTINTVKHVSLAWKKSTNSVKLNPPQPVLNSYYANNESFNFKNIDRTDLTVMFWVKKGRNGELKSDFVNITNQELNVKGVTHPLSHDNWEHFTIYYRTLSPRWYSVKIYKNGILVNTEVRKPKDTKVGDFSLDNVKISNNVAIDDFFIFKGLLREHEIKQYMKSPPVMNSTLGNTSDIIHPYYYNPFNDGAKGQSREYRQCAILMNPGQHQIILDKDKLGNGKDETIQFWFYSSGNNNASNLITIFADAGNNEHFEMPFLVKGHSIVYYGSSLSLKANQWNYISITSKSIDKRSKIVDFSVNGQTEAGHWVYKQKGFSNNKIIINSDKTLEGKIDDIKIWKTKRNLSQVKLDMTTTSYSDNDIVGYYDCNECWGNSLQDKKSNKKVIIQITKNNLFGESVQKK